MNIMSSQLPSNDRAQTKRDTEIVRAHMSIIRTLSDKDHQELRLYLKSYVFSCDAYDKALIMRAFRSLDLSWS